jgi:very-short-patch-repair endonuclease
VGRAAKTMLTHSPMPTRATILRARTLRQSMTPPEVRLWQFLRTLRAEGHPFRRQAPFRGYILDFVSYTDRLVIEIDGAQHGDEPQAAHDATRDTVLAGQGFRTLRFLATDVFQNLEGVTIAIRHALAATTPHPGPPHKGREKDKKRTPSSPSPSWGGPGWGAIATLFRHHHRHIRRRRHSLRPQRPNNLVPRRRQRLQIRRDRVGVRIAQRRESPPRHRRPKLAPGVRPVQIRVTRLCPFPLLRAASSCGSFRPYRAKRPDIRRILVNMSDGYSLIKIAIGLRIARNTENLVRIQQGLPPLGPGFFERSIKWLYILPVVFALLVSVLGTVGSRAPVATGHPPVVKSVPARNGPKPSGAMKHL